MELKFYFLGPEQTYQERKVVCSMVPMVEVLRFSETVLCFVGLSWPLFVLFIFVLIFFKNTLPVPLSVFLVSLLLAIYGLGGIYHAAESELLHRNIFKKFIVYKVSHIVCQRM